MTSSREGRNPRLAVDRALAVVVREKGRDSREYRQLEVDLKDMVTGTLVNMSKENRLFDEVRRQCSIPLPEPPKDWQPDNCRRVIYLAAEVGTRRFMRKQIMGGRWDPDKGATIRTCGVRAGLYAFADEYRSYYREEVTHYEPLTDEPGSLLATRPSRAADPAVTAEQRDRIARALAHTNQQVVTIVYLDAEGWTHKEIAAELGIDATQVGNELRRFRSAIRQR